MVFLGFQEVGVHEFRKGKDRKEEEGFFFSLLTVLGKVGESPARCRQKLREMLPSNFLPGKCLPLCKSRGTF